MFPQRALGSRAPGSRAATSARSSTAAASCSYSRLLPPTALCSGARPLRVGGAGQDAGSLRRQPWHLLQAPHQARPTPAPRASGNPGIELSDGQPQLPRNGSDANSSSGFNVNNTTPSTSGNGAAAAALPSGEAPLSLTGIPHRWRVVIMMAVGFVLCNMDKVNMSVAVIPMAKELGWSATDRGLVSSSFFWGYSLTQLPAGYISTKLGGAKVLAAGVALWSFGTLIAPPAAQMSLLALCATRVLVGLGEGFAPSAATAVLAKLVPSTERSRAVTVVWGGLDVGSAIGLLLCGPLIAAYGWPSVFYLFAILGLVWVAIWPLLQPEKQDAASPPQQAQAVAAAAPVDVTQSIDEPPSAVYTKMSKAPIPDNVPWGEFFASRPVWAITVAHFCFNWGYYTLLAWLPSYFELALGLNVQKSSFLTLIPYIAMTAMMPLVGPVADGWVKRGMALTNVRKICQGIAFVGPALCMLACAVLTPQAIASAKANAAKGLATTSPTSWIIVALMSLAFAGGAWSRAGLYCNHQDLSPKYASALLGITNTAGALPGVLGVSLAGHLLDLTGSWPLAVFYPTAACQLLGAVVYSLLASSERQSWS